VLLPGGCDMLSISGGLPHWYEHAIATHETILNAFVDLLSVIATFSFLSWPLLGLGWTLFQIGQRRRKAARQPSPALSEGAPLLPHARMDSVLLALAWLFTAGTFGMGCWVIYILILLGQFPSLYEPVAPGWGYSARIGASYAELRRSKEALDQTIKLCVFKFPQQDAQEPGDALTFRFRGWFIDTGKVNRIENCMSAAGYTAIWPGGF